MPLDNLLQRQLRERFPKIPLVVCVLANGSRSWYLPTEDTYDKGIYQESMATLEQGCLEKLIDEIAHRIEMLVAC